MPLRSGAMSPSMGGMISTRPSLKAIPDAWADPILRFEIQLRARGLREASIDTRVRHVRRLARDLLGVTPQAATTDDLLSWASAQHWAAETRHSYYVTVREFFSVIRPANNPASDLPVIHRHIPEPRPTPELVFQTALMNADDRTADILTIAGQAGLRRSEIAQLGQRWDLSTILDLLEEESGEPDTAEIGIDNLEGRPLSNDIIQVFWDSNRDGRRARRTSLWRRAADGWEQVYHQGTLLP